MPYNPDIANAFFRMGYVEAWGRGFTKMIDQCREAGLPDPQYEYRTSGVWAVFRKDIYHEAYLKELGLNERQIKALLYFKDKGEIVNAEYVKLNPVSERMARYDLTDLVSKKMLVKIGERKATKYIYSDNLPIKD